MAQNFPNFMKDLNLHIQEVQQIWYRKTSTRSTHYRKIIKENRNLERRNSSQRICSKIESRVFIRNQMPESRG